MAALSQLIAVPRVSVDDVQPYQGVGSQRYMSTQLNAVA